MDWWIDDSLPVGPMEQPKSTFGDMVALALGSGGGVAGSPPAAGGMIQSITVQGTKGPDLSGMLKDRFFTASLSAPVVLKSGDSMSFTYKWDVG